MSTDALALQGARDTLHWLRGELVDILGTTCGDDQYPWKFLLAEVRKRMVPPAVAEVLRTGEPSEELVEVVAAHLYNGLPRSIRLGVPLWCDGPDDAIVAQYRTAARNGLRAALAVLRV